MTLINEVAALMRVAAERAVLPRFRALAADEIVEKSPGELVTRADRESEALLRDGLDRLGTGARVIGEEDAAERPELIDTAGSGLVWLVDPLDGTANFAAGRGPFGIMVALVDEGVPMAGWMLDPVTGRLCHAARGEGAWIDGRPARIRQGRPDRPVAALATQFMPTARRERVHTAAARRFTQEPIPRCAAESYPRLVTGRNDVALFQRILPWDHAPGVLFLTEAGGHVTHWDGAPYRVGSGRDGVLAAASKVAWTLAAAEILPALADAEAGAALAA